MDRLTRHELKSDKFVQEVGQTVTFLEEHRAQAIRYGSIVLAVVVIAAAAYYYLQQRRTERQHELYVALQTYNASVGPGSAPAGMPSFATQAEKEQAVQKSFGNLMAKYSGSEEAAVATYMLGLDAADQGKLPDAERYLRKAAEDAGKEYSALAKLSLADVCAAQGKTADAEKLLRELIAKPTIMVSKGQATISLARVLAKSKPDEARKLLEPLRTETGAISRVAIATLADLGLVK